MNAIVTQIIQVSPIMKIFRVAPDGWELPDFVPGQFVSLALPASAERIPDATPDYEEYVPDKLIRRVYSI